MVLDEAHVYRLRGRVVPGVTRVLDKTLRDLSMISRDVLERARETGTLVHDATELDAMGELDHETIDPSILPYMKAWWRFREVVKPVFISNEEMVYHPVYDFAGKLDHHVEILGEEGILDKKSGVSDRVDEVQLSAYVQGKFHLENDRARRMKRWVLQLGADGNYKLRPCGDHFHVFLAALTCYRFKNGG